MNTDPIADFLTRIRNASAAGLKMVEIPGSNIKRAMTQILFDQGYILNYKFEEDNNLALFEEKAEEFDNYKRRINISDDILKK